MKSFIISAGALEALKVVLKSIAKPTIISTIFLAIFTLIPFSIELPPSIYDMLSKGTIVKIFNTIYYFFPVDFALNCLLTIILSHYVSLLWNMVSYIFNKIISFINTK